MTLEFEETIEDLVAFTSFNKHNWRTILTSNRFVYWYCIFVSVGLYLYFSNSPNSGLFISILIVMFLWIIVSSSKRFYEYRLRKYYRKQVGDKTIVRKTIEMSDSNLIIKITNVEGTIKWNAIESLKEGKEHLFLFLGRNEAVIIPKRIFLLPQEEYDVKSFIERKLAEQHSKS